jgi:hypothetical protein
VPYTFRGFARSILPSTFSFVSSEPASNLNCKEYYNARKVEGSVRRFMESMPAFHLSWMNSQISSHRQQEDECLLLTMKGRGSQSCCTSSSLWRAPRAAHLISYPLSKQWILHRDWSCKAIVVLLIAMVKLLLPTPCLLLQPTLGQRSSRNCGERIIASINQNMQDRAYSFSRWRSTLTCLPFKDYRNDLCDLFHFVRYFQLSLIVI